MPDVQKELIDWLHKQQDWLQEAAKKLLSLGELSDDEMAAIAERLKTEDGKAVTTHRSFVGLSGGVSGTSDLRLLSIGEVQGIENLEPRTPLEFGSGNLVVVYGHTGSGKSGYTRILKRACGKPRAEELKPNVYKHPPTNRQCQIAYNLAGTDKEVEWPANDPGLPDLAPVDIFDSDAAAFYLNRESEASYTPPAVSLMVALSTVCDRVKRQLQNQQDLLVSKLPTLPSEYTATSGGIAYGNLKPDMGKKAIQDLTRWDDADQKSLDQLVERLKADPATLAKQKGVANIQLEALQEKVRTAEKALSAEQLKVIRESRETAATKRQIATEAATVNIQSARLDGIGSKTWQALWQAARTYSEVAYPGEAFPVTGDDAHCVLCQQELGDEAKTRLQNFEAFVQGELETAAKRAEAAYQKFLDDLPAALAEAAVHTLCAAAGLAESDWPDQLVTFFGSVDQNLASLRSHEVDQQVESLSAPEGVLEYLEQRVAALATAIVQHDEDAKKFDREAVEREKVSLEVRRWLHQQEAAIRTEIDRLKAFATYEEYKKQAHSRSVTVKAGEISGQVITEAYVERFNNELQAMNAKRIRVELVKTRNEKGKALHQLQLKDVTVPDAKPETVLSEGEQRVVALAAFLADVAEKPHSAPFIFDDPISSLDTDFEWAVAARLAGLAQNRQVLIFTHRLSLYGALEDAARKQGDPWKKKHLEKRCIESFGGVAGHPADEAVWNAKTKAANNILLTRLDDAKKAGETGGAAAYDPLAQAICTDFRKLLERTVEEDLLNDVVRRHRRSVTTDNKLEGLAHIASEDCKFIDGLMTKYSCYEHSQSQEVPQFLPDENELREDIESLKTWREEFKNRQKEEAA